MTASGGATDPVLESLRERARARPRRIVLPETNDPRVAEAREILTRERLAEVVWVDDPRGDPRLQEVTEHIYERRRHKGVSAGDAMTLAVDPLYFGASLVALGQADGSVAGSIASTPDVIRAGIHCVGVQRNCMVSSMFLMVRDGQAISFADCGVQPNPDADALADLASMTAHNHRTLTGEEPRVAFLSFSTKGSAEHPKVDKVRAAVERFRRLEPRIRADGELQFDAAFEPTIAARKTPESPLEGRANVFVFPDLDAGNIGYKIAERIGGYHALGPLLQGLERPCLDLSRGCSVEDIVQVAVICSLFS